MAAKKLRLPKGKEWASLPTSKADAINLGLNRFIDPSDNQLREIRRYGSRLYPDGKVERWSARSANRGGGTGGSRQLNEALATPPWADDPAFRREMAAANALGLDGDHIRDISRTAEGIRFLEATGRGTAEDLFRAYEQIGQPLGNQAGNVQPLDPVTNQQVKPAELRAMDASIQSAGVQADAVFEQIRQLSNQIRRINKPFARFGLSSLDTLQTAVDLFTSGQTGSPLQQQVEKTARTVKPVVGGVQITGQPDPKTDIGQKTGETIVKGQQQVVKAAEKPELNIGSILPF